MVAGCDRRDGGDGVGVEGGIDTGARVYFLARRVRCV
jgi:hypothetical protein